MVSEAKLLVEEWVERLDEDRYSVYSDSKFHSASVDHGARNPFETLFGPDPQKRIDAARQNANAKPSFPSEWFGDDKWSAAKNTKFHPDNHAVVDSVRAKLANPGTSDPEDVERQAAWALSSAYNGYAVPKMVKGVAGEGNHHLHRVYLDKNNKFVGVYRESATEDRGASVHVPLEGQVDAVKYSGSGNNYNHKFGDTKKWITPQTEKDNGVFRI